MWRTTTHNSWRAMIQRCDYKSHDSFKNYGKRFISYDPAWKLFENFFEDMGVRPEGMTLDRIDSNADYCKANCRWSNNTTQQRNRRNNMRVTYNGEKRCLSEWAEITGFPYTTLYSRLHKLGWSPDLAFSTPCQEQREIYLTLGDTTLTTSEWSRLVGVANKTIRNRVMALGWDTERALLTPVPKK
ncbi:hypothetical protein MKK50_15250 [Methylobacterium sp. J-043]|nr:hypothetical protein [Methylobacterium sp. J-043]